MRTSLVSLLDVMGKRESRSCNTVFTLNYGLDRCSNNDPVREKLQSGAFQRREGWSRDVSHGQVKGTQGGGGGGGGGWGGGVGGGFGVWGGGLGVCGGGGGGGGGVGVDGGVVFGGGGGGGGWLVWGVEKVEEQIGTVSVLEP